jgi:hypothetical protein
MASHHTSPLAPTNRTNMVGSSGLATVLLVVMAMLANCERAPWQPGIAQGKPEGGNGFRSAGRFAAHAGLRLRGGSAKEIKIEHRAFVANLPRTLTSAGLRKAFEEFGKVKEARVRTLGTLALLLLHVSMFCRLILAVL